ncbi:MAG: LysM peptidoglycan-binding domain-containing protein [Chlamydiota bacterium]
MKKVALTFIFCVGLAIVNDAAAAQKSSFSEQDRSIIRKIYDRVEMMRHELGNHEAELRVFDDKLRNMEDAIEHLRSQFDNTLQSQQEKLRGSETKIISQEQSIKGFVSDLEKLRHHANDSSTVLEDYQKQVAQMETVMKSQTKNVQDLKAAMKTLMDAVGGAEGSTDGFRIYHVQPGDSLGVIAQKHNTTVRDIKDMNQLKSDTIIVGQKLKIPER